MTTPGAPDLAAILTEAAELLGEPLTDPELLRSGPRATVIRASRRSGTVVAKRFRSSRPWVSGGFGFAREWAGLQCIPFAPELYAAASGLIVMEDVGRGPTLADLLLGDDPDAAREGLLAWATALGTSLEAARGRVDRFRDLIRQVDPQTRTAGGPPSPGLPRQALDRIAQHVPLDPRAADEVAVLALPEPSEDDDPFTASKITVGAGDFCPDNVIMSDVGPRIIDLEASSVIHVAAAGIDVVQPFSTCWCLASLPTELAWETQHTFDRALNPVTFRTPLSTIHLQRAGAAAALTMTEVSLPGLLRARPDDGAPPGMTAPSASRTRMAYRWRWVVERCPDLPGLQQTCDRLLEHFGWDSELPPYPAFN